MDVGIYRSIFDFTICLILLIIIFLMAKYYYETKIPDYLVFSMFFLAIDLNSFVVGLNPFLNQSIPFIFILILAFIQSMSWYNAWILLLIHNILFFDIDRSRKQITIIGYIIANIISILVFFFPIYFKIVRTTLLYDNSIPLIVIVLTITFLNYYYNARISDVDFSTTNKVRKIWLVVVFFTILNQVVQFFGDIFLPQIFGSYVIADLLFLVAIFVIFYISYRYSQSFLLSKNHVLRALRLYGEITDKNYEKKQNESLKSEQIKEYIFSVRKFVDLNPD